MSPRPHAPQRRAVALAATALLAWAVHAAPARATLTVREWYEGEWRCSIDGRPARMVWRGAGAGARGTFWDGGGPPARLTRVSSGGRSLAMRHADGNAWRLEVVEYGRAEGWTTWNGRRYPLSCARQG